MALALLAFSGCIWKHSCHIGNTESFLGLLFTAFACEEKKHLFLPSDPGSLKQTLGRYRTRSKQVTFFFFLNFSFFFTTADGLTEIEGASRVTAADRSLQAVAHTTWTACACMLVCMCMCVSMHDFVVHDLQPLKHTINQKTSLKFVF